MTTQQTLTGVYQAERMHLPAREASTEQLSGSTASAWIGKCCQLSLYIITHHRRL